MRVRAPPRAPDRLIFSAIVRLPEVVRAHPYLADPRTRSLMLRLAHIGDAFRLSARIADDVTAAAWANDVTKTDVAYQRIKPAPAIAQRNCRKIAAASQSHDHFSRTTV